MAEQMCPHCGGIVQPQERRRGHPKVYCSRRCHEREHENRRDRRRRGRKAVQRTQRRTQAPPMPEPNAKPTGWFRAQRRTQRRTQRDTLVWSATHPLCRGVVRATATTLDGCTAITWSRSDSTGSGRSLGVTLTAGPGCRQSDGPAMAGSAVGMADRRRIRHGLSDNVRSSGSQVAPFRHVTGKRSLTSYMLRASITLW